MSCPAKRKKDRTYRERLDKVCSKPTEGETGEWETISALEDNCLIHRFPITSEYDLQLTLLNNKNNIESVLRQDVISMRRIKWYLVACIRAKASEGEDTEEKLFYLRSPPIITLRRGELDERVGEAILGVINSFDKSVSEGSRILFEKVEYLELRVAKDSPIKGSSYLPLPAWLAKSSKGLVNIQNEDEKCFLWCCLAARNLPRQHPERVTKYRGRMRELNMRGIKYPVTLKQIDLFEKNNRDMSVSVFGLEGGRQIVPVRCSKFALHRRFHVDLLHLVDEDDEEGGGHYVLIKDKSRFLAHLSNNKKRMYWCDGCITPHLTMGTLLRHRERCQQFNSQAVRMPEGGNAVMKFTDFDKQQSHDYVIYCDLESVLAPISTCKPDPSRSNTTKMNQHVPSGYCYVIVGPDGQLTKEPVLEHGEEDIILRLLEQLKSEEEAIQQLRGQPFPLDMTAESQQRFDMATSCYLCGEVLPRPGVKKVRDHDHRKEKDNFRGAACHGCNVNLKCRDFIPVFFHNLTFYDAHHIVSEIGRMTDGTDLSAIPKTKEKYVSFSWGKLRFLDSFNFLSASLDKLVRDLKSEDMCHLASLFPDKVQRDLLSRKGVYPYSYFDSFEKFDEHQLPPRECFRNDLTNQDVSEQDYVHAQNVFETFKMSSLWDYHDLYLLTDTVLLCDVMETFRRLSMENFNLDVVYYYTLPGFTWSAALLFTRQKLELLEDIDMYQMFESGLRGGVSTINHRYAQANNPYVPQTYECTKDKEYIMYLDANNLYGYGLCHPLPVGNFRFLTRAEIQSVNVADIKAADETGYLFEVSLKYPDHLHDAHNDYCLAPEHVKPTEEYLSPLQKKMKQKYAMSKNYATKKLIPNLFDKHKYVCYGSTLSLYVELGMEIAEIHRVIAFDQKPWLRSYIEFNTKKRQQSTSDFQKNLWKLMNNACFGKAIESLRKRCNLNFTSDVEKFKKLVRSPLFHSFEIFDHGLVAVQRKKGLINLNKPVYVGQVCLDVAKEVMYNFHYKCMKRRYGEKIKVLGSDTDSFLYSIKTEDVYADLGEMSEWMDTSDYPCDNKLFSVRNKKVPGKFKDEMNGAAIAGFVGIRPKMYTFKRADELEKCVGKGIPKVALKEQLRFSDYEECLKNISSKNVTFSKISTDRKHHLYTTFSTKKGLCCFDDKRFIESDNISTTAFGHYKLRTREEVEEREDEGERNLEELVRLMDES